MLLVLSLDVVNIEMSTCRKEGRGPREGIARLGLPGGLDAGD